MPQPVGRGRGRELQRAGVGFKGFCSFLEQFGKSYMPVPRTNTYEQPRVEDSAALSRGVGVGAGAG